ncbi:hypothetical protein BH09ACT10_BH09ACT10_23870 [soil metagenome]
MKPLLRLFTLTAAVSVIVGLAAATPAEAATRPGAATGVKVKVGYSTALVTWNKAKSATGYRICLTTSSKAKKCAITTKKRKARSFTLVGLKANGGADYYLTVNAVRGKYSKKSTRVRFDLKVAKVRALSVQRGTTSSNVRWAAATSARTYVVERSTSAKFSKAKTKTYKTRSTSLTVSKLTPASTYYYRVRGTNDVRVGTVSSTAKAKQTTAPISLTSGTYNICGQDKCRTNTNTINNIRLWNDPSEPRKALAGSIARGLGADILSTQEDSKTDSQFGSELPGMTLGSYKSAKALFFKSSRFTQLRSGWISMAGRTLYTKNGQDPTPLAEPAAPVTKYAAWSELQDKATRTTFLFVDPHLESGKGKERDELRYAQAKELIAKANAANTGRLPMVFAGDFNSNADNANQTKFDGGFDGPRKAFLENGYSDAFDISSVKVNTKYNSGNQGDALDPPTGSDHIDKFFVSRGVKVARWESVIRLNGSDYVSPFGSDHNPIRVSLTIPGLP